MGHGRPACPSQNVTRSRAGKATMRHVERSASIARVCSPASHGRRSRCALSWWSVASRRSCDRSGMRRAWLRGRVNIHKRHLIHVAGYNLGLIMQVLTGVRTLRAFSARQSAWLFGLPPPQSRDDRAAMRRLRRSNRHLHRQHHARPVRLYAGFLNALLRVRPVKPGCDNTIPIRVRTLSSFAV
jgi:hypothetical protein